MLAGKPALSSGPDTRAPFWPTGPENPAGPIRSVASSHLGSSRLGPYCPGRAASTRSRALPPPTPPPWLFGPLRPSGTVISIQAEIRLSSLACRPQRGQKQSRIDTGAAVMVAGKEDLAIAVMQTLQIDVHGHALGRRPTERYAAWANPAAITVGCAKVLPLRGTKTGAMFLYCVVGCGVGGGCNEMRFLRHSSEPAPKSLGLLLQEHCPALPAWLQRAGLNETHQRNSA